MLKGHHLLLALGLATCGVGFGQGLGETTADALALEAAGDAIALETPTADSLEKEARLTTQIKATTEPTQTEPIQLAQVTSVSELSDVQPGDWAYTALQRLVEEYGCLEGYPDRTYRGSRALTRYEFAAGLNACLDVVVQLIGSSSQLNEIRRLQAEFADELAAVRSDVDTLQVDVAELEANQFSTTTKLRGLLNAHLVVPFGEASLSADQPNGSPDATPTSSDSTVGGPEADATFEYRSILNFDTSFTGSDRLRLSFRTGDSTSTLANTENGLASSGGGGTGDSVQLDDVFYRFPIGDRISATVAANSMVTDDFVSSTIVPFDGSSVADAGGPEFYDLYNGGGSFGAGLNFNLSRNLILDLGYANDTGNVNEPDGGLFNNYSYIAQLNLLSDGIFSGAIAYINGDSSSSSPQYTVAGLLSLDFGPVIASGHYAYTPAEGGGDLDSYMGGFAFPNLFGIGNELGLYGGVSPAINRNPLLVEAYYQISVNEFFSLTPSFIYANSDGDNDDTENTYGAVRATFAF